MEAISPSSRIWNILQGPFLFPLRIFFLSISLTNHFMVFRKDAICWRSSQNYSPLPQTLSSWKLVAAMAALLFLFYGSFFSFFLLFSHLRHAAATYLLCYIINEFSVTGYLYKKKQLLHKICAIAYVKTLFSQYHFGNPLHSRVSLGVLTLVFFGFLRNPITASFVSCYLSVVD